MGVLDPLQAAGWDRRGSREAFAQLKASLALHYAVRGTLVICYTTEGFPFMQSAWCIAEIPSDRGRDGIENRVESPCSKKNEEESRHDTGDIRLAFFHKHGLAWLGSVWLGASAQYGRDLRLHYNGATCLKACLHRHELSLAT